jgi:hypothetical protein
MHCIDIVWREKISMSLLVIYCCPGAVQSLPFGSSSFASVRDEKRDLCTYAYACQLCIDL